MGLTLSQKIIRDHLISGEMAAGQEISIRIDQTLTPGFDRHHGLPPV